MDFTNFSFGERWNTTADEQQWMNYQWATGFASVLLALFFSWFVTVWAWRTEHYRLKKLVAVSTVTTVTSLWTLLSLWLLLWEEIVIYNTWVKTDAIILHKHENTTVDMTYHINRTAIIVQLYDTVGYNRGTDIVYMIVNGYYNPYTSNLEIHAGIGYSGLALSMTIIPFLITICLFVVNIMVFMGFHVVKGKHI